MSPLNRNLAILVAEDDESYALLLTRAFGEIGLANPLHLLCHGQQVIDYLSGIGKYADRASYPLPGMMVLDLKMPRVDGFGVLRWIRQHPECGRFPKLILSSSDYEKDIELAYELGADGYLVKPEKLKDLKTMLREAHAFWSRCAERRVSKGL